MSVFGFIENFFFISLGLVFVLVVFLVYHFKNRITVAEKKSESMYGLLTAVVKEIKILRGMFGLGGNQQEPEPDVNKSLPINEKPLNNVVSKTIPEVNVPVHSESSVPNKNTEVISFEITPSENKILVSDEDDSDSDSDDEYSEDDESTISDDSYSDVESVFKKKKNSESQKKDEGLSSQLVSNESFDLEIIEIGENVQQITEEEREREREEEKEEGEKEGEEREEEKDLDEIDQMRDIVSMDFQEIGEDAIQEKNETVEYDKSEPVLDLSSIIPQTPSVEQLKKMNINQLKTVASQLGISTDTSKLKKPELISLIREKGN